MVPVPMLTPFKVRTAAPSNHTSTRPALMFSWSSTICQLGPTDAGKPLAVHRSGEPFSLGLRQADLKSAIPEAQYIEAAKLPVIS